jgi:hypothetical protein
MGSYLSSQATPETPVVPQPPPPPPSTPVFSSKPRLSLFPLRNNSSFAVQSLEACAKSKNLTRFELVDHLNAQLRKDGDSRQIYGGSIERNFQLEYDTDFNLTVEKLNGYLDREVLHRKHEYSATNTLLSKKSLNSVSVNNDDTLLTLTMTKSRSRSYSIYNLEKYAADKCVTLVELVDRINTRLDDLGDRRHIHRHGVANNYVIDYGRPKSGKSLDDDMHETLEKLNDIINYL